MPAAPTAASKALQDLLAQQQRVAALMGQRHREDMTMHQRQWQQRQQWHREQKTMEQRQQRNAKLLQNFHQQEQARQTQHARQQQLFQRQQLQAQRQNLSRQHHQQAHALGQRQQQEATLLKALHGQQRTSQASVFQQRFQTEKTQQKRAEKSTQQRHTQQRAVVGQLAAKVFSGHALVQELKKLPGDWSSLSSRQRQLLEQGAQKGTRSNDLYQLFVKHQEKREKRQQQQHQQTLALTRQQFRQHQQTLRGQQQQQAHSVGTRHEQERGQLQQKQGNQLEKLVHQQRQALAQSRQQFHQQQQALLGKQQHEALRRTAQHGKEREQLRHQHKTEKRMASEAIDRLRGRRRREDMTHRQDRQFASTAERHQRMLDRQREREESVKQRQQTLAEREQKRQHEHKARHRQQFIATLPYHATSAMYSAAAIGNAVNNPLLSHQQTVEHVGRAMPGIVGEAIGSLIEFRRMIDGTTLAFQRLQSVTPFIHLQARQMGEKTALEHQRDYAVLHQQNRAAALRGKQPFVQAMGDVLVDMAGKRDTWQGELAYQKARQRFGARAQVTRAEAEAEAARKTYEATQRQVQTGRMTPRRLGEPHRDLPTGMNYLREYGNAADRTMRNLQNAHTQGNAAQTVSSITAFFGNPNRQTGGNALSQIRNFFGGNQGQVANQLENSLKAQQAGLTAIRQLHEDINRSGEARLTQLEKERQLQQAKLNELKVERNILQQEEQRQANAAQTLGAMKPWQRNRALMSARMGLKFGEDIGAMPEFMKRDFQAIAPGMYRKMTEQAGLKSREYKEMQQLGLIDKGELAETRKKMAKIDAKVEVKLNFNETVFADKVATALAIKFGNLLKAIEAKFHIERNQEMTNQMNRAANSH